ncbi:MAG TPA: flagellar biosynthetic protein FliQ [Polyangiaceae bacterium]|nr:flagellar biosynthetic protein FliQ [Polyangiaceae bacterium]
MSAPDAPRDPRPPRATGLLLTVGASLPVLAVAAVVGLVVAAFQAASQIQDPTLAHLPRLLAVVAALALLGPWMGHAIAAFAAEAFAAQTFAAAAPVR